MQYYKDDQGEVYGFEDDQLEIDWVQDRIQDMHPIKGDELDSRLNPKPTAETSRAWRDKLLDELDAVVSNPLRWESLTDKQRNALKAYRQALLDVPQQEGFPDDVEWPSQPKILR